MTSRASALFVGTDTLSFANNRPSLRSFPSCSSGDVTDVNKSVTRARPEVNGHCLGMGVRVWPALTSIANLLISKPMYLWRTTGSKVADVGCGRGRALIKLAQAFPHSKYAGFDIFPPTIELATRKAAVAGLGDRLR